MSDAADGEIEGFIRSHGPFESPPLLTNGESVGEWTIRAFLGRGGSAEVYRAENKTTGIVAALKVLCRSDDRTRERFRREAQLVAEIGSSTFPKFYGAGGADGRFYIAEELLEPMPLPKTDAAVARFVLAVAAGVEELHRRGFVHRDIKPRNVMMRPATGESVLIDMGLAKEGEDASQICNDTVSVVDGRAVGVGTPGFSAPEQFAGGKISPATDIHALGMLANVCFGGKPPSAWAKIIRRSTSSIPEQRYATVSEFARAVRHRHAERWLLVIIAIILSFLAFLSHLFWGQPPRERLLEHPREWSSDGDGPFGNGGVGTRTVDQAITASSGNGDRPSENVKYTKSSQASQDKPLTKKEFAEALLNATYDVFYGSDTNIDRKTAIELMRKGMLPSY